jgi:tRNA-splicing ligase RtcB
VGAAVRLLNREEMMDRVVDCFEEWTAQPVERSREINCHHNYTERAHFGKDVWLSRKGAIDASEGRARPDPRLDGHRVLRREGKGNRSR